MLPEDWPEELWTVQGFDDLLGKEHLPTPTELRGALLPGVAKGDSGGDAAERAALLAAAQASPQAAQRILQARSGAGWLLARGTLRRKALVAVG